MRALATTGLVLQRQFRAALADPGPFFILPMLPALLTYVVFATVFDALGELEGFDAPSFTAAGFDAFISPGAVMLVALLGGGFTSTSLAADLRSGYGERLSLAGSGIGPHLAGRAIFEGLRIVPGAIVVLLVSFGFGGQADNGIAGALVLLALAAVMSAAFGGIFHLVAIATEDPQTPLNLQPIGLPLAFLSTALAPLAIMPGWSEAIARFNPVTRVVDAGRQAMIGDLWSTDLVWALVVLAAAIAVFQTAAWNSLSKKLTPQ